MISTIRIVGSRIEWKGEASTTRTPRYHDTPVVYEIHITPGSVDIISADGRAASKVTDLEALLAVSQMASDLAEQVVEMNAALEGA